MKIAATLFLIGICALVEPVAGFLAYVCPFHLQSPVVRHQGCITSRSSGPRHSGAFVQCGAAAAQLGSLCAITTAFVASNGWGQFPHRLHTIRSHPLQRMFDSRVLVEFLFSAASACVSILLSGW